MAKVFFYVWLMYGMFPETWDDVSWDDLMGYISQIEPVEIFWSSFPAPILVLLLKPETQLESATYMLLPDVCIQFNVSSEFSCFIQKIGLKTVSWFSCGL